jgi:hypothetical protein
MKRQQAYKLELRPNGEQQRDMRRFAGSCRSAKQEPTEATMREVAHA